jgi:hypothetical protein
LVRASLMSYNIPPRLNASDFLPSTKPIESATELQTAPAVPTNELPPANPIEQAERDRIRIGRMSEDEKQRIVANTRQLVLDFATGKRTEPIPLELIREAVMIARNTYVPIMPTDPETSAKIAGVKAGTVKKPTKVTQAAMTQDILKNLFASITPPSK